MRRFAVIALLAAASAASAQTAAKDEAHAWKLSVTFEDDVEKALLEEWRGRMELASQLWFEMSQGQFWIAECAIEDKSGRGRIYIPAGNADRTVLTMADAMGDTHLPGSPAWRIRISGKPDGQPGMLWTTGTVVAHELGHAVFGLVDERDSTMKGWDCRHCIMGSDPTQLCSPDSHEGDSGKSCRERIAERFKDVVFPNPKWKAGTKAPKTKFTIVDRGAKDASPDGAPFTAEEKKLVGEMKANGRAFSIKVAFEGDATAEQVSRWRHTVDQMDGLLRFITKEQFFIAECTIEDKCDDGDIVIEKGSEEGRSLQGQDTMWTKRGNAWLTVGLVPEDGFARYVFADWLGISETDPACAECFLNTAIWDGRTRPWLCGDAGHTNAGLSCVKQLVAKFAKGGVVAPASVKDPKPMPPTRYHITDR